LRRWPCSTTWISTSVRLRVRVVLRGALLRALLAVEHVRARGLVLAAAHQRELDLVLDLLDVDRAAVGLALDQRADDGLGEVGHLLAHARDAALCPPFTARNALVIAIVIFDGSKPTTAPLRRITLYCESRGSALLCIALPGSPIRSRCGGWDCAAGAGA
jgi:hypothetical protein